MKNRKQGFTLAELLIVVAIIAVLVSISIPIFNNQLEKSREATDAANIRSQYAQVMSDAIMDGVDIDGSVTYGAVQLKQKKDNWDNEDLGISLESVFDEVIGAPKANGEAWVEYQHNNDYVILHYDGTGSDGEGDSDNSGDSSDPLQSAAKEWPSTGQFHVTIGEVYNYEGQMYISLSERDLNPSGNPKPGGWYEYNFVSPNGRVLTSENVDASGNVIGGVKRGDIFNTADGKSYIMKTTSDWQNAPNGTVGNWVEIKK